MSQPPPPPPPSRITNTHNLQTHKPNNFPDFFFTALSIFFFFSSSSSSSSSSKPQFPKIPFLCFPSNPRRFLRIPSMSVSKTNHRFGTPQSLSEWLKPRLPSDSLASWGVKPGTKNVHNLWLELSEGETFLADSTPPIRTVSVVTVRIIGKNNQILVESHQELSDGGVRNRCRPLSEKMKPNETPEAAVYRAIKEELGSIINDGGLVRIVPGSYKEKVEERNSMSYPGLPARYVLHSVDVTVDGLPEGEFCTEEVEEYTDSEEKRAADKAVFVKKHFWKWVSSDSVQS
ncbi:hypothetical protein P3X46_017382 [Hevea brasiliensis]|uniref:Nudix hydrolase domain-containing protein n=1 Tax=Hevea brasiliensis TaxID=3981 RepID=A0ABQ9M631_HEVBR|nr:uncharacterized protein LOC110635685 [Hevea brasiliensis]KAJ9174351.1 hypothetical protein P3X46_017382 [Hevea brasiliensis]